MDSREDEQERGITMVSSAISLLYDKSEKEVEEEKKSSTRFLINLIDSPGHVDFASQVSVASRLCDGCLLVVDAVEGVCVRTMAVLRHSLDENIKPILVINKIDRLVREVLLSTQEAACLLTKIIETLNSIIGSYSAQNEAFESWSFSPEAGNVVFCSALDGWSFRIQDFALIYAKKMGMNFNALCKCLFGEYFYDAKNRKVLKKGASDKAKNMFSQFILDNIWAVYENVFMISSNEVELHEKVTSLCAKMNLSIAEREFQFKDRKLLIRSIMSAWLPLYKSIFDVVVDLVPNPIQSRAHRIDRLFSNFIASNEESLYLESIKKLKDQHVDATLVYVSKMIPVKRKEIPNAKLLEEMKARNRERILELRKLRLALQEEGQELPAVIAKEAEPDNGDHEVLIGMARVYCGKLKRNQSIFLLKPRFHPSAPSVEMEEIKVDSLFLLMGRDLEELEEAGEGCIIGIGGLDSFVSKTCTLSSSLALPSIDHPKHDGNPIVRVALEAVNLSQNTQLISGLKLLNQADPCVEISINERGEHILATAGELHLQQCIKDLSEKFAKIEIQVSEPLVPFRETISNIPLKKQTLLHFKDEELEGIDQIVTCKSSNIELQVSSQPLSSSMTKFLYSRRKVMKEAIKDVSSPFWMELEKQSDLPCLKDRLICFGPKGHGANMLLLGKSLYEEGKGSWLKPSISNKYALSCISSLISGFQTLSEVGPLCGEHLMGVAFVIESISSCSENDNTLTSMGESISLMREACKKAFFYWSPRICLATYSCDIQTSTDSLGKVYAVLSKRNGKILKEEYHDETGVFVINSLLPVVESFGFADDIRSKTSGAAIPQLIFQGYEVLDEDPFCDDSQDNEEDGAAGKEVNNASKYIMAVRKRKGMFIERKLDFKQRTLKK